MSTKDVDIPYFVQKKAANKKAVQQGTKKYTYRFSRKGMSSTV